LLPFTQQRVRARELAATPIPASHILIVENERCLHQLQPLLLDRELLDATCSTLAVNECRCAGEPPPEGLTAPERDFYQHLRKLEKGRIEQEFLPRERAVAALEGWHPLNRV
jgi:hypothetical protein